MRMHTRTKVWNTYAEIPHFPVYNLPLRKTRTEVFGVQNLGKKAGYTRENTVDFKSTSFRKLKFTSFPLDN